MLLTSSTCEPLSLLSAEVSLFRFFFLAHAGRRCGLFCQLKSVTVWRVRIERGTRPSLLSFFTLLASQDSHTCSSDVEQRAASPMTEDRDVFVQTPKVGEKPKVQQRQEQLFYPRSSHCLGARADRVLSVYTKRHTSQLGSTPWLGESLLWAQTLLGLCRYCLENFQGDDGKVATW